MKSICLFSSYFHGNKIPYYIEVYLTELARNFSKIVFITNDKELDKGGTDFLSKNNIDILLVANEGYDFGMWYKALEKYDVTGYDRLGLVNDSCVLFGKLDEFFNWFTEEMPDYAGFTDSHLIHYHIQSYFVVMNKSTIPMVIDYFKRNGIRNEMAEVIRTYEVGLSGYLANKGRKVKAMYSFAKEKGSYNNALVWAKALIGRGFPMIKKKIISREYKFEMWRSMVARGYDPFPASYMKMIEDKSGSGKTEKLFNEIRIKKGLWGEINFRCVSLMAIVSRIIRKQYYGTSNNPW